MPTPQLRNSIAADRRQQPTPEPWPMINWEPATPLSALTDLADMCEEAADEMHECETEDEAHRCARDYLNNHVFRLADDAKAICPNTLFGGEPIAVRFHRRDETGDVFKPIRSLHDLIDNAVCQINIWHGDVGDVSDDFREAFWVVRNIIERMGSNS